MGRTIPLSSGSIRVKERGLHRPVFNLDGASRECSLSLMTLRHSSRGYCLTWKPLWVSLPPPKIVLVLYLLPLAWANRRGQKLRSTHRSGINQNSLQHPPPPTRIPGMERHPQFYSPRQQ